MMDINIAIIAPVISVILQAIKQTGYLPGRFVPMTNVLIAIIISALLVVEDWNTVIFVTNTAALILATEGSYRGAKKLQPNGGIVPQKDNVNEPLK